MQGNLLLVAEEIDSVVDPAKYQGTVSPVRSYPYHSEAPDGSYRIMTNGDLCVTYRHPCVSREVFSPIFLSAIPGLSIQMVSHWNKNGFTAGFSSFTVPIGYRYDYSMAQSFLNAFRPGFRMKEYSRFRELTELAVRRATAYAALSTSKNKLGLVLDINEVCAPLTNITLSKAIPQFSEEVKHNLSYLRLPNGRCATAVGFLSPENIFENGIKLPPTSLETLILSLVRYPDSTVLSGQLEEIERHRRFAALFKTERDESSLMTMDIDRLMVLNASRGFAEVQNYMLFIDQEPDRLRRGVQEYLAELTESRISYAMSFLNTVDAFSSVFPGNVRVLRDGARVDFTDVANAVEGFHTC